MLYFITPNVHNSQQREIILKFTQSDNTRLQFNVAPQGMYMSRWSYDIDMIIKCHLTPTLIQGIINHQLVAYSDFSAAHSLAYKLIDISD